MNRLLIISFLVLSQLVSGQSDKNSNAKLLLELKTAKATYDSILQVDKQQQKDLVLFRGNLYHNELALETKRKELTTKKLAMYSNHQLLQKEGFNANSIISTKELFSMVPTGIDQSKMLKLKELRRDFAMKKLTDIQDLTGVEVKDKNKILQEKIDEYDSINRLNISTHLEMQQQLEALTAMKKECLLSLENYNTVIRQMEGFIDTLATTCFTVRKEKEEAWRKNNSKTLDSLHSVHNAEMPVFSAQINAEIESKKTNWEVESQHVMNTPAPEEQIIYDVIEEPAEFPDGRAALNAYLAKEIVLPEVVKKGEISGKVYVRFIISESGNVSNVTIKRSIADCTECDEEAVRVVQSMPDWKPAKNSGKAVNSWYNLPITFKLPE